MSISNYLNDMTESQVTQVNKIVNGIITDTITQMIEDMSSNDFIELVMDRLEEEGTDIDLEGEDTFEDVKDVVGESVIPLLMELTGIVLEKTEEE